MIKKIAIFALLFTIAPMLVVAVDGFLPLIPCDGPGHPDQPGGYEVCNLCHLFQLVSNVVGYFLVYIVPPVAAIFIAYGGIVFYTAGGSPERVTQGRKVIFSVLIGLFIIYSAHYLVGMLISALGVGNIVEWPNIQLDC